MSVRYHMTILAFALWSAVAGAQANPAPVAADQEPLLPRVLLIGDSISLGYDEPTRVLLEGKAVVSHPPDNCQSTVYGLTKIKEWLGDGKWDVIHFNWGIWDAHHLEDGRLRTTPEEYEKNLRELVDVLKATGAKLIWASTTPMKTLHHNVLWVEGSDIPMRNDVAKKVMQENKIAIDDLYAEMLPRVDELRSEDGCHYSKEGYAFLAERVARSIAKELGLNLEDHVAPPDAAAAKE